MHAQSWGEKLRQVQGTEGLGRDGKEGKRLEERGVLILEGLISPVKGLDFIIWTMGYPEEL